jgi:hypothetical protein
MTFFKKAPAPERRKITEPFDAVDLAEVFGADLADVVGGCAACGNPGATCTSQQPRQDLWQQQQR